MHFGAIVHLYVLTNITFLKYSARSPVDLQWVGLIAEQIAFLFV